tara:strand:- start:198 stop:404 length:207 start_codon:yes stop_codon:yes gene_type:complete
MFKLLFFVVSFGFMFADSSTISVETDIDSMNKKYSFKQDYSFDDEKIEAGRRRGKKNRGRKRGGSGLR